MTNRAPLRAGILRISILLSVSVASFPLHAEAGFSIPPPISTSAVNATSVVVADIDGDGDTAPEAPR